MDGDAMGLWVYPMPLWEQDVGLNNKFFIPQLCGCP